MKKFTTAGLFFVMLFMGIQTSSAQSNNAVDMFKNHINGVVKKVQKAESPQKKRELMNQSFDKMLSAFNKVESMKMLSSNDQTALDKLKKNITNKKHELNGTDGYPRVKNNQLNDFSKYVQQDIEQADSTITISVTVLLLVVIIIILLA